MRCFFVCGGQKFLKYSCFLEMEKLFFLILKQCGGLIPQPRSTAILHKNPLYWWLSLKYSAGTPLALTEGGGMKRLRRLT